MSRTKPRFGIWAPYRGPWVVDRQKDKSQARFAFSKEVVPSAERAGFDTVLFAQHTINPKSQDEEILEAWTASAAAAAILPGFVGSYDQVARRFAEFYEIGVGTFLLSFFPLIEEQERFAAEVIPRVLSLTDRRPGWKLQA